MNNERNTPNDDSHALTADQIADLAARFVDAATPLDAPIGKRNLAGAHAAAKAYLPWAGSRGIPLVPEQLFAAATVEEYRSHLLECGVPSGTATARSSYLKRLHPTVGLAGTTRRRAAAPTSTGPEHPAASPRMAPELVEQLDSFRPRLCPPELWSILAPVVIAAVATVPTQRPDRARDLVRAATLLAAHVHRQNRPLRTELVFDAATVASFVDTYRGQVHRGSLTTYVSSLRAIQRGLGYAPAAPLEWELREPIIYDDDAIDELQSRIARLRTAHRRRHVTAVMVLVFGAGYFPRELGWARADHLVEIDGVMHARIHTPERWNQTAPQRLEEDLFDPREPTDDLVVRACVPFLPAWQEAARQLAVTAELNSSYLLGGATDRRRARVNQVLVNPPGPAIIDLAQARARWMADVLAPVLGPLRANLGVSSLHLDALLGDHHGDGGRADCEEDPDGTVPVMDAEP